MARLRFWTACMLLVLTVAACGGGAAARLQAPPAAGVQLDAIDVAGGAGVAAAAASASTVAPPAPALSATAAPLAPAPEIARTVTSASATTSAPAVPPAPPVVTTTRSASTTTVALQTHRPAVTTAATSASARIGPLESISQTLNNCGPATVAEVLAHWGIWRTQGQTQAILRADGNPRGMEPYGVPAYMHTLGMDVLMGVGGDQALVKALVANGFPVIVSQWVSLSDHYGHYRPIDGYDDGRAVFISTDPYLGPNHVIGYDVFDQMWATRNGQFMVIYPPAKGPLLQAVLAAAGWDKMTAYQTDLARLQHRLAERPTRDGNANSWESFGSLQIAWDQLNLGQYDAASQTLNEAAAHKANPVVVKWIAQAIADGQG